MHFTKLLATTLALVATGASAAASPVEDAAQRDFAPMKVGRRLSRKHLQRRHQYHHHHHGNHSNSNSASPTDVAAQTVVSFSPEPTTTEGGDDGDCSDAPTVTVYTTITSTPAAAVTMYTTITTTPAIATSTDSSPAPTTTSTSGGNNGPSNPGAVIQAPGSPCGDSNAVPNPAPTSGPNGDENWLNCGVDNGGWIPPPVTLDNLIYRDLAEVLQENGNIFEACSPYLDIFQQMSSETGIPTIFLASISLQESGCNPTVTGGAGEIGMMQITSEKCPTDGSDCYDPATNIRIGAQYFRNVIDNQCAGNVACAMGGYNGWGPGLTVESANNYAICAQHNNLDYLQDVFNGFLQGVDPSSLGMGIYHNTC